MDRQQKPQQEVQQEPQVMPQVDFLSRVAKFPMVHSAMEYASDAYNKTKDMSPALVQRTLSTAENSVSYAMRFAQPVVNTLEGPIHAVDTLACKTLDKVEVNLPVITKTPDEIMTSTRTYVTDKLQPVQNGVSSAVNTLSVTADMLLSNPVGNLALNTMEFAVTTFRSYVDYFIPPVSGDSDEKDGRKVMDVIPTDKAEPSQKILWSIRYSYDSLLTAQHRVSLRAQHVLHDVGLTGLLTVGYMIDLFQWVIANWKEMAFVGLPSKLNQFANQYRGKDEAVRPGNTLEDVTFLAGYWMKQCVELLRSAVNVTNKMANSEAVLALRMQLSIALAVALDSVSRVVMIFSSTDIMEKSTQFLKSDLPLIHKALVTVKSLTNNAKLHAA